MSTLVVLICIVILFSAVLISLSILFLSKTVAENNDIQKEVVKISHRLVLIADKNLAISQDSFKMNQNYLESVEEKNIREITKINQENQYLSLMIKDHESRTQVKTTKEKSTKKENNQP